MTGTTDVDGMSQTTKSSMFTAHGTENYVLLSIQLRHSKTFL